MSKHQDQEEDINIGEVYSNTEKFLDKNKQSLTIGLVAILAIVVGSFYYFSMYLPEIEKEAQQNVYQAQQAFAIDSFELAMYGGNDFMGFEEIIDNYGASAIGNTSKYYMAVSLMNTGDYEGAIEYYKSYSPKDHMTSALTEGGIGDCLSQLEAYEEAVTAYEKAANAYVNEFTTPIYLKKAGILSEDIGDYEKAVKFYERIKSQYPDSQEGRDIEKYLAHAQSYL